ncbi:MAG: hypothetical protein VX454_11110 [Pseudomonadota bacterium]|nr:hypothetical protein [Pseudomonadota bacterium]
MGAQIIGGPSGIPSAALLDSAVRRLSRDALADLCEQLIDRLDALDGDPDLEPAGDELDGTGAEDDHQTGCEGAIPYPGCPIADPGEDSDSDYCEASDDRGSSGPNALFRGFVAAKQIEFEEDCERWHQPVSLGTA